MTYYETFSLIRDKKWTELLRSLDVGENELAFGSVQDIASCKAVAYSINSDNSSIGGVNRNYYFRVDKQNKRATIIVKETEVR